MTVSAGIEIGAAGSPAPGMGKAPGGMHGAGLAGIAGLGFSPSALPSAASFRTGWQSLLAELNSGLNFKDIDGPGVTGAVAKTAPGSFTTGVAKEGGRATGVTKGRTSGTTATLEDGTVLSKEQGSGEASAAWMPAVHARAGASEIGTASVVTKPLPTSITASTETTASTTKERKPAKEPETAKEPKSGLTSGSLSTQTNVVIQPAIVASASVVQSAEGRTRPTSSDLSRAGLPLVVPTASATASTAPLLKQPAASVGEIGPVSAAAPETTGVNERLGGQGQTSSVPGLKESSKPTASTIESLDLHTGSPLSYEMQSAGGDPGAAIATSQGSAQWMPPSGSSPLPVAANEKLNLLPTPSMQADQSVISKASQAAVPSPDPARMLLKSMNQAQTVELDPVQTQSPVSGSQSAQATVSSPIATDTAVQISNSALPVVKSENQSQPPETASTPVQPITVEHRVQASAPSQIQTDSHTPAAKPVQADGASQSPTPAAAPISELARTTPENVSPAQLHAVEQDTASAQAMSKDAIRTAASNTHLTNSTPDNQDLNPVLASTPMPAPTILPRQNRVEASGSSLNSAHKDFDQSPIQPLTLSLNPALDASPKQSSTQKVAASGSISPALPPKMDTDVPAVSTGVAGASLSPAAISATADPLGQISTAVAVTDKTLSSGGGKTTTTGAVRNVRGTGKSETSQTGSSGVPGQNSSQAVDASAAARAVAGAGGAASVSGEPANVKTASTTGPDPRETFATLDAQGVVGRPAWIHAGAQRAEVGFEDPALGWVGVRADASGGGVHAELVAGSADAAQALSGHMAGLNAFLAEHHTPVDTLTLTSTQGGGTGLGGGSDTGQNMQQGAGQETGTRADFQFGDSAERTNPTAAGSELPIWASGSIESATTGQVVGGHISVMA